MLPLTQEVIMSLPDLEKDELFKYLKSNKDNLIAEKKQELKFTDSVSIKPVIATRETKVQASKEDTGSDDESVPGERDKLDVTVVCNTANFCDSHMDVLTADSYTESVKLKGNSIPHIADHKQTSTAHVGDVQKVYTKELPLKELGLDQVGSTIALVMETTIRKDYNDDVFKFYANGKINQHSIGLRYQELRLALDSSDPEDVVYKEVWDKYYPEIINKDVVDKRGYFWAVTKVDVIENSCVLFGANSLTPTLAIKSDQPTIHEPKEPNHISTKEAIPMSDNTTAEKLVAVQAELEALKSSRELDVATAVKAERNRSTEILKSAATFGVKSDTVMKAVSKGWSLDVVADYFSDIAEKTDEETAVKTGAVDAGSADAIAKAALEQAKAAGVDNSFGASVEEGIKALSGQEQLFSNLN